ncbi:MAG TPA: hypothetical protein DCL44_01055 [Elusimicrobia bacterium]|nr:hypothetical protein [Elusimicrobiota bacterium]
MQLLIDPAPPAIKWGKHSAKSFSSGECLTDADWLAITGGNSDSRQRTASVVYRLRHGGELVRLPAQIVTPKVLEAVGAAVRYLPEYNELTYAALKRMLRIMPKVPHILLCDTAFFMEMPLEASAYALSPLLRARGLKRYGDYGLTHQWAFAEAQKLLGPPVSKVISIHLGDHPNMAAVNNGRPLDTTIGFTPVEGLPSHSGCGDIDVSVVFELQAAGFSLKEINTLLSARSGFRGLTGTACSFMDLMNADTSVKKAMARKILLYDIIRYSGAFSALLGGADAILFITEEPSKCAAFIQGICSGLEFLGLRCRFPISDRAGGTLISEQDSRIKVMVLKGDIWRIMIDNSKNAVQEEII